MLGELAIALMALRPDLVGTQMDENTLLDDLDVDQLDRAELGLFIEDETDSVVTDVELHGWETLGDVLKTYRDKTKELSL